MEHKHEVGLYIGRFQPFHKGHLLVVRKALEDCNTLVIAVGSSQENRTKKNPFTYEERKLMIERSCQVGSFILARKKIIVVPVPDRLEYSDDASWGQYVLDCVEKECGLRPSVNFEGKEQCRSTWFEGLDITQVVIARDEIPYSATTVREAMIDDRYKDFCKMVSAALWLPYYYMRDIVREVYNDDEEEVSN